MWFVWVNAFSFFHCAASPFHSFVTACATDPVVVHAQLSCRHAPAAGASSPIIFFLSTGTDQAVHIRMLPQPAAAQAAVFMRATADPGGCAVATCIHRYDGWSALLGPHGVHGRVVPALPLHHQQRSCCRLINCCKHRSPVSAVETG